MSHTPLVLSLENLALRLIMPVRFELAEAEVEVDGDRLGRLAVSDARQRLEAADEFAVLVLEHEFTSQGALEDLIIAVPAAGLRNLALDGTYLVPAKALEQSWALHRLPTALRAGQHKLQWSLVWSPPVDRGSGEVLPGGVQLLAPEVRGACAVVDGVLAPVPAKVSLRNLQPTLPGAAFAVHCALNLPPWPVVLHIEGPQAGSLTVRCAGQALDMTPSAPHRIPLPVELSGTVDLELVFAADAGHVSVMRLDPA
jgi:hypothetical protein